jgi:hypothetical protein
VFTPFYRVIKKSLCTWWLQYRMLQVMFSVPRQSPDTRLTLTASVISNSNYIIMVSDWNCLNIFVCFLYCNHQVHRDLLITLYILHLPEYIFTWRGSFLFHYVKDTLALHFGKNGLCVFDHNFRSIKCQKFYFADTWCQKSYKKHLTWEQVILIQHFVNVHSLETLQRHYFPAYEESHVIAIE